MNKAGEAVRNVIAGFVVGSFIGALGALYVVPIPTENKDLIVFMLGQLSGFMGGIMAYHFGTSKSSVDKNHIIASMGATAPADAKDAARQVAAKADDEADRIASMPEDGPRAGDSR